MTTKKIRLKPIKYRGYIIKFTKYPDEKLYFCFKQFRNTFNHIK